MLPGEMSWPEKKQREGQTEIQNNDVCEECSTANNANVFICNASKDREVLTCHMAYHKAFNSRKNFCQHRTQGG